MVIPSILFPIAYPPMNRHLVENTRFMSLQEENKRTRECGMSEFVSESESILLYFLVACTRLYNPLCPSVRLSVTLSGHA